MSKKVKAKQNLAKDVETTKASTFTTEQLALMLNKQYQQLMEAQNNIREINSELRQRETNDGLK